MKNNKNPYYITLDDIRARSTPGAVKVLEGSSGGKMPNTTNARQYIYRMGLARVFVANVFIACVFIARVFITRVIIVRVIIARVIIAICTCCNCTCYYRTEELLSW